jgi:hypothetical protein
MLVLLHLSLLRKHRERREARGLLQRPALVDRSNGLLGESLGPAAAGCSGLVFPAQAPAFKKKIPSTCPTQRRVSLRHTRTHEPRVPWQPISEEIKTRES